VPPRHPPSRRLGRPHRRSESFGENKNPLRLSGIAVKFLDMKSINNKELQQKFLGKTGHEQPVL
jgi:hypothetical protein